MATAKIILLGIDAKSKEVKNPKTDTPEKHYPIVLRLTHKRIRKYITLNVPYCRRDQWIESISRFDDNYTRHNQKNKLLDNYENKAEKILEDFEKFNQEFSFELFKQKFKKKLDKNMTVFQFWDEVIDNLKSKNKIGNARSYEDAKRAFSEFRNDKDLSFPEITVKLLRKYKDYLTVQTNKQDEPLKDTTIHIYLRTLRAVYNKAIQEEIVSRDLYPFGGKDDKSKFNFSDLNLKTKKRAIQKEHILEIMNYNKVSGGSGKELARDLFIFSYLTRGMNFIDMARLKKDNIIDGRIEYKRAKTGVDYSIKIDEHIQSILDRYENKKSKYIFPVLNDQHNTPEKINTRIKTAIKLFNTNLRKIAEDLGIETHLTSYVARHTFATVLRRSGVSTTEISESMKHTSEKTTQIYLEEIDPERIDKIHENLL